MALIAMFGLYLLVVPGIVLLVAPSLFIYSLLWWCTRAVLQRVSAAKGWRIGERRFVIPVFSAVIVAIPAVLVPYLINIQIEDEARRLRADDRELEAPIVLPPTVALVIDGNYDWLRQKPFCETLCLRLLFNSAVARVIAIDPSRANATSAYRVRGGVVCVERPSMNFGVIWKRESVVNGGSLMDRVQARILSGDCLLEGDGRPEEAAMTISYREVQKGSRNFGGTWHLHPSPPVANRLEILDGNGATIYRRTEVTFGGLMVPLLIWNGVGIPTFTSPGWARANKTLGYMGRDGQDVFPLIFGEAVRTPEARPAWLPR